MSVIAERKKKARLHVIAQVILSIWCVFVINAWIFHTSIRSDWTEDGVLTITESDRQLVEGLPGKIEVVLPLNMSPGIENQLKTRILVKAARWLEELSHVDPNKLSRPVMIEVNRDGEKWERERIRRVPVLEESDVDKIHFFFDDRRISVAPEELASFRFPTVLEPEGNAEILLDKSREGIEAALRRLVTEDWSKIYISQGSGEPLLEENRQSSMAALRDDLEARGAIVEPLRLAQTDVIPEDADLLLIVAGGVGGFEPLGAAVVRSIDRYLESGGGVAILLPATGISGLEDLMARAGISVSPGLIAEEIPLEQGFVRPAFVAVGRDVNPDHPATASFGLQIMDARFSPARALQVSGDAEALLYTGPGAWIERDGQMARRDPAESPGPRIVAAASDVGSGRLVVAASWTPVLTEFWRGDSRRFLLSCFGWAAGDSLPLGAGREPVSRKVELSPQFRNSFFWTAIFVLPSCAFIGGLLVAAVRRRKA